MNIEELKLILQTVQSLGADTKDFAMWWLAYEAFRVVLNFVGLVGGVWVIAYTLLRIFSIGSVSEKSERFMKDMRKILSTGTPGHLSDSEFDDTAALLHELALKHRAQQQEK